MPESPPSRWCEEGRQGEAGTGGGAGGRSKLGAHVHASIDGKVRAVTPEWVEIVA